MTEVILFKESMPRKKEHGHVTETINGIQLPGQEPIFFHKRFTSRPISDRLREIGKGQKTEVLTMRQEAAERLGEFCVNYLLCESGDDFSCKTFVDYVSGYGDKMESPETFRRDYHVSDPVETLKPGEPYVATSDTEVLHAMLGTHRPTHGLSITGNGMPLELIDVNTMHEMYGSNNIRAIHNSVPPVSSPSVEQKNKH